MVTASAATTNARVTQDEAQRSLEHVRGMTVEQALKVLRFSPGHTCPPLERVLCAALADVRARVPGCSAASLVVSGGRVGEGDVVTRLRRHAHGDAYWLSTHTTSIEVEIAPAGSPDGTPDHHRASTDHGDDRHD
jgi:large subunit ribosomal protein L22